MVSIPILSIVVPVYNAEDYISDCVESILGQQFADFELILVNDGSSDGSAQMCNQYQEKDSRIKVYHKENGGVSSARNYGIKMAHGTYLCFIDSDDWIDHDFFTSFAILANPQKDIYVQGYKRVKAGEIVGHGGYSSDLISDFSDFFIISEKSNLLNSPCFKLFKRELVQKNHILFDENFSLGEDHIFTLQYLLHSQTFNTSIANGYNYRIGSNENSLTTRLVDLDKFIKYIIVTHDLRLKIANKFNFNRSELGHVNRETNKWVVYACHKLFDPRRDNSSIKELIDKFDTIVRLMIKPYGMPKYSFKGDLYNSLIYQIMSTNLLSSSLKIKVLEKVIAKSL